MMKGELYEYNGQYLSQAEIAKKEKINRSTLADWYKKTGNMADAVTGAKKSLAQRNIEYNGEILSLKAIARKEEIKFESLKKNWEETEDIYKSVKITKEAQLKRNGSIEYYGKMLTIHAIAQLEEIERHALTRYYEDTNDIYESVKLAKQAKEKHNGTIEYKGKIMTITGIANLEGIKRETLKEYYDIYNNIEKAVLITKESQIRRKQALLRGKKATYEELSSQLQISIISLDKMISEGISVDDIEKKMKKGVKKENQLRFDEDSLYKYCINNSYNYWVILYMINNYNKTPEEAIKAYIENGQQIPTKWIYEKYNLLFKHLMLNFNFDSNRIVNIMKKKSVGINTAIEELIFITNNNEFKLAEIYWLKELYSFLKELNGEDLEIAKKTFYITEKEINFLIEIDKKIEIINRQLLLFEFSEVLTEWPISEIKEMMELYGITNDEIKTIVLNLFSPFKNKVINPTEEHSTYQKKINDSVCNENIDITKFTLEEQNIIKLKRELLSSLINSPNTNEKNYV